MTQAAPLPASQFGEGIALLRSNNRGCRAATCIQQQYTTTTQEEDLLYQFTWTSGNVWIRNAQTLDTIQQVTNYPRQGWGATTNGDNQLIVSDGTAFLHVLDHQLKPIRTIPVVLPPCCPSSSPFPSFAQQPGAVATPPALRLNDLQWMPRGTLSHTHDLILANDWPTSLIHAIADGTGQVVATWDFASSVVAREQKTAMAAVAPVVEHVLNGIARRPTDPFGVVWITGKCWQHLYQVQLSQVLVNKPSPPRWTMGR
jgi:glutamine cyclotransferase